MDVSSLDLARMAAMVPEGVAPGTDMSSLTIGTVTGLDPAAGLVQIVTAGSEPVWVPAAPFIYGQGVKVRLRRSALDGGRLEYCEGPLTAGPAVTTGRILSIDADVATVETMGDTFALPYVSSTYAGGDLVLVLRHPSGYGVPQLVLGLAGAEREAVNPGGGSGNPGQSQSRQAVISPHDTGAWRASVGRWNQWNANRWGGARALWQGNAYNSGPMVGWAGYGDQVINLHAAEITGMWVDITRADTTRTGPRAMVVQGSPHGTRPGGEPAGGGEPADTGPLALNQTERVRLQPSTYEAWRTGAYKGLRTVGGDYFSAYGADKGGAMALTIQYTVVA